MMLVLSSSMELHAICRVTFAEYTSKSERVMSDNSNNNKRRRRGRGEGSGKRKKDYDVCVQRLMFLIKPLFQEDGDDHYHIKSNRQTKQNCNQEDGDDHYHIKSNRQTKQNCNHECKMRKITMELIELSVTADI